MAEQEACAELVEKASEECVKKEPGSIQGESLLLPLLQGLLDAPENEQPADSGTESGEDLRSGLILEVQSALDKLSASLKSNSSDVSPERRDSLLQLVSRLQAGLSTQLTPTSSSERRSSLQGRFSKRRQRANRHTVGVTSEELEDARRLMEEIAFRENINPPLQKQNSEGSVLQTAPFPLKHQTVKPVKNLTAKPFNTSSNTSQSQSGTSSTVETPTETSESLDYLLSSPEKSQADIVQVHQERQDPQLPDFPQVYELPTVQLREKKPQYAYRQSLSLEQGDPPVAPRRPLSEAVSLDYSREVDFKSVQKAVTTAAAIKQLSQLKSDVSESTQDSETDDDPSTIKVTQNLPDAIIERESPVKHILPAPQPDLIMQANPLYARPNNDDSDENDEYSSQYTEKANRFNSKRLKMKRANTIDIPKPLKYYEYDDDSDVEQDFNSRRSSYLALRGPIRVGKLNADKKVPDFEPKTDSDRKFMAFINKHNERNSELNKTSIWASQQSKNTSNWNNKFDHIKTTFEKVGTEHKSSVSSARNFWKSADDAVSAGRVSNFGPKISRQSAKNLQQMFEEKQKQSQQKAPWSNVDQKNVVTGSLKVDTKAFEGNKNVKVVTQPSPFNKFSHAPMSAFKPVPKKSEPPPNHVPTVVKPQALNVPPNVVKANMANGQDSGSETPLYLYSPKPLSPQNDSPVANAAPWLNRKSGESRVLSLAVAKFENLPSEQPQVKPRKMSKDKIAIPPGLQQTNQVEKLTAPYLVKSLGQSNSVRKLSGQYDNIGATNTYVADTAVKHALPTYGHYNQTQRAPVKQSQNYTPPYRMPENNSAFQYKADPKMYNAEYIVSTQHYNKPQQNTNQFSPTTQTPYYHNTNQYNTVNQTNRQYNPQYSQPQQQYQYQRQHSQPQMYETAPQLTDYDQQQYTSTFQFKPTTKDQQNYVTNTKQSGINVSPQPVQEPVTYDHQNSVPVQSYDQPDQQIQSESLKKFDYPIPPISPTNRPTYQAQTSQESVKEYTAVSSKVMSGPVSQQAVTVQQNAPKNRNQHDMEAAFNLKSTLQKFSQLEQTESHLQQVQRKPLSSQSFKIKTNVEKPTLQHQKSLPEENNPPALVIYNNVSKPRQIQAPPPPNVLVNDKLIRLESLETNERGESVVTSKFHIPIKPTNQNVANVPTLANALSKSESWHQICQGAQTTNKPLPKPSTNSRVVSKSKSSHTLAVPKQYEAGMSKSEMLEKRRTLEAYFGESKTTVKTDSKKSAINRIKTSQKISTQRQNSGLCRSKTLPDIVCLDKVDDCNIDEVFEDLFQSCT